MPVMVFDPTLNVIGADAVPEVTLVPLMVTVAVVTAVKAYEIVLEAVKK